jgi:ABC-type polysaccharide/polyol phosphate transport system ATPase subunit
LSNNDLAIEVVDLSKVFRIYNHPVDLVKEVVFRKKTHRELWALKDVSFQVKHGEMIGIIGRNGSGKSTLLKILTGVLDKTQGEVSVDGRISSILELGTGFHPEYTGRQNIFMGGLCLGMSRRQIEGRLHWIIDFSELHDFIDQPLRTYSTGMKARLAFSTAISMDPDILFVDEALSVGDVKFNRKCFNTINKFRNDGKTILLVSHDLNVVSSFCDKTILLDQGRIVTYGEPRDVTRIYHQLLYCDAPTSEGDEASGLDMEKDELMERAKDRLNLTELSEVAPYEIRCGARKEAEIIDFGILDQKGNRVTLLNSGERYTFHMRVLFYNDVEDPAFGFSIRDVKGVSIFGLDTGVLNYVIQPQRRGDILEGRIDVTMWLTNGEFFLSAGIGNRKAKNFDFRYDGLLFSIPKHPMLHTYSLINLQPVLSHQTLTDKMPDDMKRDEMYAVKNAGK